MDFKEELLKKDLGYSKLQRYLIYVSSVLLFICMFLQFWIDVKPSNFDFAICIGVFLIFFLYIVSKGEKYTTSRNTNKADAIFASVMAIVLLAVVIVMYWNSSLMNIVFVLLASIINLIVFLPHALS